MTNGGSRTIPEVQNFAKRRLRRTASDHSQSLLRVKKKIIYHSRRGWICGDVNSWLTASTWSPQAWLTFVLFFISLCLLRTFVAWWPETPPPLRTPQSPADGRPGSRSLSRAVASSMKLYRTCHLRVIIIYYLFLVPAGHLYIISVVQLVASVQFNP